MNEIFIFHLCSKMKIELIVLFSVLFATQLKPLINVNHKKEWYHSYLKPIRSLFSPTSILYLQVRWDTHLDKTWISQLPCPHASCMGLTKQSNSKVAPHITLLSLQKNGKCKFAIERSMNLMLLLIHLFLATTAVKIMKTCLLTLYTFCKALRLFSQEKIANALCV